MRILQLQNSRPWLLLIGGICISLLSRERRTVIVVAAQKSSAIGIRAAAVAASSRAGDTEELDDELNNIVGGTNVNEASKYPFFAIPQDGTLCGATLVHEDILVTAAHCAGVFSNRDIYIGTTSLKGEDAREKVRTTWERIHPNFDEVSMDNDVMLVKLATKSNVTPAQFTLSSVLPATSFIGTVIGFGAKTFKGEVSQKLQEVKLEVLDHSKCETGYGKMNSTLQFCASMAGKDACTGDSGGPMLTANNVLVGIVSFGFQCGSEGFPGVYTRVGAIDDFITSGICAMSSNPPSKCEQECVRPLNRCSGLFTKRGSRMHKMDGNCVETCASFFTSLLKSSGWRCGRCP